MEACSGHNGQISTKHDTIVHDDIEECPLCREIMQYEQLRVNYDNICSCLDDLVKAGDIASEECTNDNWIEDWNDSVSEIMEFQKRELRT